MKRPFIRTGIAAAAFLIASMAAQAADFPGLAYKAPYPSYDARLGWSGLYVGLNGGYGFGTSAWSGAAATTRDIDVTGALAGGTIGYNLQTGAWVWGVEADFDATWMKGSNSSAACLGCETSMPWLGTARGRIGYAFGRWLPYLTGGAAYGNVKMTSGGNSDNKSKLGWAAGAGIEYAFMGAWSTKLEYLYADLGSVSCGATVCVAGVDVDFKTSIVRLGLNYRF